MTVQRLEREIRGWLLLFMIGLALSGLTAFPLAWEADLLLKWLGPGTSLSHLWPGLAQWIALTHRGIEETSRQYPFMAYGTDWLAFGHLMIALSFVGPLRDPVRNVWGIEFGLWACALVLPIALFMGPVRHIPVFWRIIDCSFGIIGAVPLWLARKKTLELTRLQEEHRPSDSPAIRSDFHEAQR